MFKLESEMHAPARQWLESQGMSVYEEFSTNSGPVDLVGIKLNATHIQIRKSNRQSKPLTNVIRARLLHDIPDRTRRRSITRAELLLKYYAFGAESIHAHIERLIDDRFLVVNQAGKLQKVNGWMPLHERFVAIELKLSKVTETLRQALNNLSYADESFIGLPREMALRTYENHSRWDEFFKLGIGLLAVDQNSCEVLIASSKSNRYVEPHQQMVFVERAYRKHLTNNSSSRVLQLPTDAE